MALAFQKLVATVQFNTPRRGSRGNLGLFGMSLLVLARVKFGESVLTVFIHDDVGNSLLQLQDGHVALVFA